MQFSPAIGSQFSTIEALSKKLGIDESRLIHISNNVENFWKKGASKPKSDGSIRLTNDARRELKNIHARINIEILEKCEYPDFLQGALKGRSIFKNADQHTNTKVVICEDIASYFPNTTKQIIKDIWQYFFKCPEEVADVLANLTTYQGMLPQGWKTSSYLANLVFWDLECEVVLALKRNGFSYTRFVDDVTISHKKSYKRVELTRSISNVQNMFRKKGFSLKRGKHSIKTSSSRQMVNGLLVNKKVALDRSKRDNIRASVFKLEEAFSLGANFSEQFERNWRSVACNVGRLKRGNPIQHANLRNRLEQIRY
jgi:intein-encoded DNA endonuclease-like protein